MNEAVPFDGVITIPDIPVPSASTESSQEIHRNVVPVSDIIEKSAITHEGIALRYLQNQKSGVVGFQLVPAAKLSSVVRRPDKHKIANGWDVMSWTVHPLVGLHLIEDPCPPLFTQGRSLQSSPSAEAMTWVSQTERTLDGHREIVTRLRHRRHALEAEHIIRPLEGIAAMTSRTRVHNTGTVPLTLHLLTSFSLGGMTPFAADEAPGRIHLHRFRSSWSQEGRHVRESLESLHLEPSWTRADMPAERFGQLGSMPVRGFFPTAILEDSQAGVFWGAQLAWLGSWQIEVLRRGDSIALTGGLADFEFGHWQKTLAPGEAFETPTAFLTCAVGSLDLVCETLLEAQRMEAPPSPAHEDSLPQIYNEFCLTWGSPSEKSILNVAARLKDTPVKYLVVDAGWYAKPSASSHGGAHGDWRTDPIKFPRGFRKLNAELRAQGFIPGIWFEFEVTTKGADVYCRTDQQLKRLGHVLDIGSRRFWDFRNPWVRQYLSERVIEFLRQEDFGYLKVDYNDTIGPGCDSPDGLGEGLRQHLQAVHAFFQKIRAELPELVIENCASGGHRLEPLMVGSTSMSSFSDAHEGYEIPWISANLQRLVPPEKLQIWAVVRPADSARRLHYTMSAGLLGRLCLSGQVTSLNAEQWSIVQGGLNFYQKVAGIIKRGTSRRFGIERQHSQHLAGHQAIRRISQDHSQMLVVWHSFATASPASFSVPLPSSGWRIEEQFNYDVFASVCASELRLEDVPAFSGGAILLRASPMPASA